LHACDAAVNVPIVDSEGQALEEVEVSSICMLLSFSSAQDSPGAGVRSEEEVVINAIITMRLPAEQRRRSDCWFKSKIVFSFGKNIILGFCLGCWLRDYASVKDRLAIGRHRWLTSTPGRRCRCCCCCCRRRRIASAVARASCSQSSLEAPAFCECDGFSLV
jgi:hypothetical protein